jgi:uncharacterized membrane protein
MSDELQVVSAVFSDEERAESILEMLQSMHRASTIELKDAALVIRQADGKLHIKETKEVTTAKGAKRGAIIAGIFGVIYPPSLIASVIVGGGLGAFWGKIRDTGIKNSSLKQIGDKLQPGQIALVALTDAASAPKIEQAFQGYEAQPVRAQLSSEESTAVVDAANAESPTQ